MNINLQLLKNGNNAEHSKMLTLVNKAFNSNFKKYSNNIIYDKSEAHGAVIDAYLNAVKKCSGTTIISYILYKCKYGLDTYIRKTNIKKLGRCCNDCGLIYRWSTTTCYKCNSKKSTTFLKQEKMNENIAIAFAPEKEYSFFSEYQYTHLLNSKAFNDETLQTAYIESIRENLTPYHILLQLGKSVNYARSNNKKIINQIKKILLELQVNNLVV